MKNIFCLFLAILLFISARSTSIVIVLNNSYILIGADSKEILTVSGKPDKYRSVSKICQTNQYLFVLSGLVKWADVDLERTVGLFLKKGTLNPASLNKLAFLLQKEIYRMVAYLEKDKLAYQNFLMYGKIEFVIAGIESGRLVAHRIVFFYSEKFKLELERREWISSATMPMTVWPVGKSREIDKFIQGNGGIDKVISSFNDVSFIEKLIGLEIAKDPDSVGLPIDIARITKDGILWIKRKRGTPVVF